MIAGEERAVNRAVNDALGGVGLTALDQLPPHLERVARARYLERIAERDRDSGGHAQAVEPRLRGSAA